MDSATGIDARDFARVDQCLSLIPQVQPQSK